MPRGLSPAIITALSQPTFAVETLVEIYIGAATTPTLAYTTGFTSVTIGTVNYLAAAGISIVGNIVESYNLSQHEFTLQLEGNIISLVNTFDTNRNRIRVVAYKMFRDPVTNVADTTNLIKLYDSIIDNITIQSGAEEALTIEMKSRPVFTSLDRIKSRTNGDLEAPINVEIVWGSILWQ